MTSPTDPRDSMDPLDSTDLDVLARLAAIHTRLDPPPADLDARVGFALALEDVDAELARLATDLPAGAGARDPGRSRTLTFEADSRTILVTIETRPDGLVRVDGWLAPPAAAPVALRRPPPEPPVRVTADEAGRFVFTAVPPGLAQLRVDPPEGEPGPRVVTPTLVL